MDFFFLFKSFQLILSVNTKKDKSAGCVVQFEKQILMILKSFRL